MFDYESEDQSSELSQESQFKVNFFLHPVDHAIALLNDQFEQTHFVTVKDFESSILFAFGEDLNRHPVFRQTLSTPCCLPDRL